MPQPRLTCAQPLPQARPEVAALGAALPAGKAGEEGRRGEGGRRSPETPGTHQGASRNTAQCRPCPCVARSPGRRGPPSGCSNSAGPAALLAPGTSAAASGSGQNRALRGEVAPGEWSVAQSLWGQPRRPARGRRTQAHQPLVNKPVRDMRRGETMPNTPGLFSPEEQRTSQLLLLLFPIIKLLTIGHVTFIT